MPRTDSTREPDRGCPGNSVDCARPSRCVERSAQAAPLRRLAEIRSDHPKHSRTRVTFRDAVAPFYLLRPRSAILAIGTSTQFDKILG